jgi:ion channel
MFLALLVGAGVLLGSMLVYGMATALILRLVVHLIRRGYTGLGFWRSVAVMMIVTLITAAAHLGPITLWAVALLMSGEISTFEKAFYFSAENYTALGYGDIVLSERWRLLGPLEAINGLLLFGLSTAVMFAVLSRLIANRLHLQLGDLAEAGVNQKPMSAAGGSGSN